MEDLQRVNKALNALWKLYKQMYEQKLTDELCDEWIQRTREIYEESGGSMLVVELVVAFMNSIDRRDLERRKCGEAHSANQY